jgi:hypothetical protein
MKVKVMGKVGEALFWVEEHNFVLRILGFVRSSL